MTREKLLDVWGFGVLAGLFGWLIAALTDADQQVAFWRTMVIGLVGRTLMLLGRRGRNQ